MTEDWAAVSKAVKQRRVDLGLTQIGLGKIARVSKQTVGEIERNKPRDRSPNTLRPLSEALQWHPDHLAAVLAGQKPPDVNKPYASSPDDIPKRFDIVEHQIQEIRNEIKEFEASLDDRFSELRREILNAHHQVMIQMRRTGR